ncbi:MAG: insulinase family protein [Bacteroidales bacterium]|nr:insulinase family protein [Bacteroidales bacterium]
MKEVLNRKEAPPVREIDPGNIPEAQSFKLENGIRVYLIESGNEELIRMEFTFKAGQIKEESPLVSTTTNMMLTEGTENYTADQISSEFDFLGAFPNHSADKDTAGFVVYCLNRHVENILRLCREVLFSPVFPEKELDILMKKRLRLFQVNREKVQNLASDKFFESIFGESHPYGWQVSENHFTGISSAMLSDFHGKYYTPENMAVIVSGKIPEELTKLIELHFGDLSHRVPVADGPEKKPAGSNDRRFRIKKPGAVQSAIRLGKPTINKRHPDYPGLKVLNTILGGYFGSRLMKNLREEKGYTYGVHSSLSSLNLSGFMMIATEVNKNVTEKAVDEILKEITRLQNEPVGRSELSVVRNYMTGEIIRMFDGPFALAESFKAVWDFGLDNNYYYRLLEKIKTIEPDEITELARTYYKTDELYEIIAG